MLRSISTWACKPPSCWSLVTSANSGAALKRATNFGTQARNTSASASSNEIWYCVGLTLSSMVKSCTDCMNNLMPCTSATAVCKRAITSSARSRSANGFKLIKKRPVLSVALLPSTPMKEDKLSTAGSCKITRPKACWRSAMAAKDKLVGPCETA